MDNKDNDLVCPICGKPTRIYMGNARKDRLCAHHADMLKKGEIEINSNGDFIDTKTKNILNTKTTTSPETNNNDNEEKQEMNVRCIACGKPTEPGYFFCRECYHKYKNKNLLLHIKNCRDIEILNESYEGIYQCKDGHIVKSKSERDIDNYLFEHKIPHAYEKIIYYDSDPTHTIKPDFCLPNFNGSGEDVYIEHWGYNENNIDYTKTKKFKINIYKKLGFTLISTHESDMKDPESMLDMKLRTYIKGKVEE